MIVTTAPAIEGEVIGEYRGLVSGEVIINTQLFSAGFLAIEQVVGKLLGSHESLQEAREEAIAHMIEAAKKQGANAIIAVNINYSLMNVTQAGNLLMISATGTAVRYVD